MQIIYKEHTTRIKATTFHPTKPYLTVSNHLGVTTQINLNLLLPSTTLEDNKGPVRTSTYNPQGTHLCIAGDDTNLNIYDTNNRLLNTLKGNKDYVRSVSFHPFLPYLVSASDDQTVRIYNYLTGKKVETMLGHTNYVMGVKCLDDCIISVGLDGIIRIWHVPIFDPTINSNKEFVRCDIVEGHDKGINTIDVQCMNLDNNITEYVKNLKSENMHKNMNYKFLATGDDDGNVKIYKFQNKSLSLINIFPNHAKPVTSVKFYKNFIFSASEDGKVILTNLGNNKVKVLDHVDFGRIWSLDIKDGNLAVGADFGWILFDVQSLVRCNKFSTSSARLKVGEYNSQLNVNFYNLIYADSEDNCIKITDFTNIRKLEKLEEDFDSLKLIGDILLIIYKNNKNKAKYTVHRIEGAEYNAESRKEKNLENFSLCKLYESNANTENTNNINLICIKDNVFLLEHSSNNYKAVNLSKCDNKTSKINEIELFRSLNIERFDFIKVKFNALVFEEDGELKLHAIHNNTLSDMNKFEVSDCKLTTMTLLSSEKIKEINSEFNMKLDIRNVKYFELDSLKKSLLLNIDNLILIFENSNKNFSGKNQEKNIDISDYFELKNIHEIPGNIQNIKTFGLSYILNSTVGNFIIYKDLLNKLKSVANKNIIIDDLNFKEIKKNSNNISEKNLIKEFINLLENVKINLISLKPNKKFSISLLEFKLKISILENLELKQNELILFPGSSILNYYIEKGRGIEIIDHLNDIYKVVNILLENNFVEKAIFKVFEKIDKNFENIKKLENIENLEDLKKFLNENLGFFINCSSNLENMENSENIKNSIDEIINYILRNIGSFEKFINNFNLESQKIQIYLKICYLIRNKKLNLLKICLLTNDLRLITNLIYRKNSNYKFRIANIDDLKAVIGLAYYLKDKTVLKALLSCDNFSFGFEVLVDENNIENKSFEVFDLKVDDVSYLDNNTEDFLKEDIQKDIKEDLFKQESIKEDYKDEEPIKEDYKEEEPIKEDYKEEEMDLNKRISLELNDEINKELENEEINKELNEELNLESNEEINKESNEESNKESNKESNEEINKELSLESENLEEFVKSSEESNLEEHNQEFMNEIEDELEFNNENNSINESEDDDDEFESSLKLSTGTGSSSEFESFEKMANDE